MSNYYTANLRLIQEEFPAQARRKPGTLHGEGAGGEGMPLPPKLSEADIGAPQSGAGLQKKPLPQCHGKGQSEKLHGEGAGGEGMPLPPKLSEADISAPQSGAGSPKKQTHSCLLFW